jgi:choline dehydrogenase-like flavoprotein
MKNKKIDILIIGAGAAGSAAAWNLSKSNFKITCLEQGDFNFKKINFDKNNNQEILKQNIFNINPNIRKLKSDYPINDKNSPISIANFNGVGGSTILYSGHYPRFHPSDFRLKSLDNIADDWPFSYDELEKYYNLNDRIMGVAGLEGDPAYPKIKKLLKPVKLGLMGQKIAKAFQKLKWHWWPSYSAFSLSGKGRGKVNTINSADEKYWPEAIKNGVNLKTKCRVIKIISNNKGKVTGAIYFDGNDNKKTITASIIIVACSGIGTPRLLLNSANKFFPNGLANSSGLVGKNLMLHPLGFAEGVFKENLNSSLGPKGCCIYSHQFYETNQKNKFKRGYTMQILRGSGPIETSLFLKKLRKLPFGKNFHKNFLDYFNHTVSIGIICEDLPDSNNCIKLDKKIKDSDGMPGVKVNYRLSENTKKMLSHGLKNAKKVLEVAGAKSIITFGPVKHTGWHIMGTTKMGNNKKTSVVNANGQSHDTKNLVIVDSSIFTTSSAVNPASTIQAMALKITDKIKKETRLFC